MLGRDHMGKPSLNNEKQDCNQEREQEGMQQLSRRHSPKASWSVFAAPLIVLMVFGVVERTASGEFTPNSILCSPYGLVLFTLFQKRKTPGFTEVELQAGGQQPRGMRLAG